MIQPCSLTLVACGATLFAPTVTQLGAALSSCNSGDTIVLNGTLPYGIPLLSSLVLFLWPSFTLYTTFYISKSITLLGVPFVTHITHNSVNTSTCIYTYTSITISDITFYGCNSGLVINAVAGQTNVTNCVFDSNLRGITIIYGATSVSNNNFTSNYIAVESSSSSALLDVFNCRFIGTLGATIALSDAGVVYLRNSTYVSV